MKRSDALRRLSSEHHQALVLARRVARIARDGDANLVAEGCLELSQGFEAAVARHFHEEEEGLLPLLAAAGEEALAERTRQEHRQLRDLVAVLGCHPNRDMLKAFAEAMEAHVRFEERELYEAAQAKIPAETLAAAMADSSGNPGSP